MHRYLLFLALAVRLSAQETMIREVFDPITDTHVEVLALFSKPAPGGYLPVRVKIANNLKSDSSIRLDFQSQSDFGNDLKASSTFNFTATAGKTVTRDILVPLCPPGGSYPDTDVRVQLTGSLGRSANSISSSIANDQPAILLSEALFTPNASSLDSEASSKFSSSGRGSCEFAAKFDPKQLPDDWLAFSGYDSMLLTDTDWSNIPPGGRNAILSWVRLGGQLVVFQSGQATAASLGLPEETSFGSILIRSVPLSLALDAPEVVKLVTDNPADPQQVSVRNDFRGSWPLQAHFGTQTFHYALFVVIMVAFGILVGPVNLFVFAKSGQRHKLFITTPLISLGASVVLIGLIIQMDGFGGNGLRRVLMEVRPDAGLNAAFIHQEQFSRTGVLTGAAFTIDTPSLFQPVPIAATRMAGYTGGAQAKGNFNLQPADGKLRASGDWFQSRTEQGQALSAVRSTRGRIERTDAPGVLLSTFEFPIDTLFYLDESSQWHRADAIVAGKRFTLTPVEMSAILPLLTAEANAYTRRNREFLELAVKRPGHFTALTTRAPGIDTYPGINWRETRTVITGPVVSP